jgi:hypothetical protein
MVASPGLTGITVEHLLFEGNNGFQNYPYSFVDVDLSGAEAVISEIIIWDAPLRLGGRSIWELGTEFSVPPGLGIVEGGHICRISGSWRT